MAVARRKVFYTGNPESHILIHASTMETQEETPYVFEIYLDTTSSCVAAARETGKTEVVNIDRRYTIP